MVPCSYRMLEERGVLLLGKFSGVRVEDGERNTLTSSMKQSMLK